MKKGNVLSLLSVITFFFGLNGVAHANTGGVNHAVGSQPAYSLSIQAFQGPTSTDLYINTTPTSSSIAQANTLKKVQLKTFDPNGDLVYTRNYNQDVATPNGTADIQLSDVKKGR